MARLVVALLVLLAFVGRVIAPDAAMADARAGGGGIAPEHCAFHVSVSVAGQPDAAPEDGGGVHRHNSCPICHIGWAPAAHVVILPDRLTIARRVAVETRLQEARFAYRPNPGAPPRGPPLFL